MAFVNEYIPANDLKKYDFAGLDRRPSFGTTPSDQWSIDRDADIWLRKFYTEMDHTDLQGGFTGVSVWDFWWKGNLLQAKIKDLAGGGRYGAPRWAKKKLLSLDVPPEIECHRLQIIRDLESALTAYRGAGILAEDDGLEYAFSLEA